jgi:hypothetical protein
MVGQFDFSDKAWVSGAGRRAVWSTIPADSKRFAPQFLIMSNVVNDKSQVRHYAKFAIMRISSATNERTVISAFIPAFPAQHSLFTGRAHSGKDATLLLTAFLNSFVFDYFVRQMCAGVNVTGAILDECPLPSYSSIPTRVKTFLTRSVARLTLIHRRFAPEWLQFRPATDPGAFARSFALTLAERTRLRAISDALVAELYGLTYDDLKWILRECDRPASQLCSIPYTRKLNQKGFWRVDKDREPELRHPILTLIAFNELKEMIAAYGSREAGIAAFCDRNDGEGWKLPETLRLADYDMGHDERAAVSQPVAASLGATFLPWQLEMSVEESWTECERNARTLLGEEGYARLKAEFGFESDYPPATRTHAKAVEAPSVAHRTQSTLFPKVDE